MVVSGETCGLAKLGLEHLFAGAQCRMRPCELRGKVQSTGERAEARGGSGNFIPSIARKALAGGHPGGLEN